METPAVRARVLALFAAEGFELVRVAPAEPLPAAREHAADALARGNLQGMDWISATWIARATDPSAFLPAARAVILAALPCHAADPERPAGGPTRGRVARYARGRDYHRVFEKKLRHVARTLAAEFGAGARATVDYGPLLERAFAARAGLGWPGKSTMLLAPGFGPWVLLGAVATTLELEPDAPLRKTCGACSRCITACPTGALDAAGNVLDARRCISYHTIENRGPIPVDLRPHFRDWIFGCDDCLDACPVGAGNAESHPDFVPPAVDDAFPGLTEILALDEAAFDARFRGRAIMRAKREGLARNACVALGNVGTAADLPALRSALQDESPLVREHAAWAIDRLAARGVTAEEPPAPA